MSKKRRTWLTRFAEVWERKTKTPPNYKRLARELGMLKKEGVPVDLIFERWVEYVFRTPARYLSPTRFRETFAGWDVPHLRRVDVDRKLDAEAKRKEQRIRDGRREETLSEELKGGFFGGEDSG